MKRGRINLMQACIAWTNSRLPECVRGSWMNLRTEKPIDSWTLHDQQRPEWIIQSYEGGSFDFAPRDDLDSHFRRRTTKQENHCATWSWRCKKARLWSRQRQVNVNFYSGFANHNPRSRQEKSNELSNRLTHDECVIYAASKHTGSRENFFSICCEKIVVRVSPLSVQRCQTAQIPN